MSRNRTFTGGEGLQPERTRLAWQRTYLALLVNGGLLLLRESDQKVQLAPSLLLAVASMLLAALVAVLGRRRTRVLSQAEVPSGLPPSREVALIGWAVVVVCLGGVVVLALPGG